MKKILYLIIFFIMAGGVFYITRSVDPKKGLTIEEIGRIINGKMNRSDGEKVLNNLKSADLSKLDVSKQKEFLNFVQGENLFKGERLKDFINSSKNLQGSAKELYYKILYNSYKTNPQEFLKIVSNLKTEEIITVFKTFINKYAEKSKIVEELQNVMNDSRITGEQKDKLYKLVEDIK